MASTYTEGLVIELIGSGDKAGSWGDVTNNNLKSLDQGVSGFSDIDLTGETGTGGDPYIVNLVDAQAPDESTSPSRSSVIRFYDQGTDAFVIRFQTNGAASTRINSIIVNGHASRSLVVGTGTGGTVTIPATYSARVHGDGIGLENSLVNLSIDKLALGNQEVISNTVDDRVDIVSSTLQVGDGSGDAVIQSDGTGSANRDLVLRNSSTNTGSIRINDAANGNIEITPDGSGKVVMDKVNIGGGEIDGTPIGANSANTGVFTSATVDDIVLDGKVITMTGSASDTATLTAGTNGTLDIVTTDAAGTAANIQITADGTAELAGTSVTLDASSNITLDADGGTVTFADGGVSLGTITSSGYSGNAATVTTNANLTGDVTSTGNATAIATGVIINADVNASAAIAYSKLGSIPTWNQSTTGNAATVTTNANLTGDVTSTGNATAIGTGVIVNADVNGSAAIAYSKLGSIPTWNQSTTGTAANVTTNANLTGDVTSSGNSTTIADDKVDEAMLKVSNTPVNDYVLSVNSVGAGTGTLTWVTNVAGDITDVLGGTNITVASSGGPQPTASSRSSDRTSWVGHGGPRRRCRSHHHPPRWHRGRTGRVG